MRWWCHCAAIRITSYNVCYTKLLRVEHGEVALIDPRSKSQSTQTVRDNQVFGGMSFLTGSHHTVSAMATPDVGVSYNFV